MVYLFVGWGVPLFNNELSKYKELEMDPVLYNQGIQCSVGIKGTQYENMKMRDEILGDEKIL